MIPCCILAIEDDDDRAFMEHLFVQYHRLMYRKIIEILHDPWATDDVMQSVLEKLIDKVKELREKDRDRLVNYIISACKNRARNYIRDKGNKHEFVLDEYWDHEDIENSRYAIELRFEKEAELERLAKIWPKLDERSQYLLEGRYILEKSPDQMAKELGLKPDSIRMALSRARKNANKLMQEELEMKG